MALGVRTLQRAGLDPAAATASIGINQVAGVLVHLALLFAFVAWTGRSGLGGFSLPDSTVLLAGIAVVLGLTGVWRSRSARCATSCSIPSCAAHARRSVRSRVCSAARCASRRCSAARRARRSRTSLRSSRAIEAFGGGLSVPQIGAAYLGASLVGNAAPTPGGLGAIEAALVAALTGFGLESGHAVSAVLTFRLGDLLVADAARLVRLPVDAEAP